MGGQEGVRRNAEAQHLLPVEARAHAGRRRRLGVGPFRRRRRLKSAYLLAFVTGLEVHYNLTRVVVYPQRLLLGEKKGATSSHFDPP